ncbi:hypothetical protein BKA63DRAFT_511748, partial [Paraphoma chrysanthemicola]
MQLSLLILCCWNHSCVLLQNERRRKVLLVGRNERKAGSHTSRDSRVILRSSGRRKKIMGQEYESLAIIPCDHILISLFHIHCLAELPRSRIASHYFSSNATVTSSL